MEHEENLARAISAAPRREILRLLADGELTVKHIAANTKTSVSLTSRHLTFLTDLGLLKVRKEFPYKYYSLKVRELKQLIELYDKVIPLL